MFHGPRVLISSILLSQFNPKVTVHPTGLYKQRHPSLRGEAKRNLVEAKEKPLH
jgi:hypothetical protein